MQYTVTVTLLTRHKIGVSPNGASLWRGVN